MLSVMVLIGVLWFGTLSLANRIADRFARRKDCSCNGRR